MTKVRMISAVFVFLIGVGLLIVPFFIEEFPILLGGFFVLFGIIIFLNRGEDNIEQIKSSGSTTKSKKKRK